MPKHTTKLVRGLAIALVVAAVAACHPNTLPLTPKEQTHMNALTAHMTPRCVGRYLIDLPQDMRPGETFQTIVQGVYIEIVPMARSAFDARLDKRRAALEQQHMDGHPEQGVLKAITPLPDEAGVIFNRAKGGLARGSRVLELHGWRDGYAIKMHIESADSTFPEYKDDPLSKQIGTDTPQKLALLKDIYSRTRGRADDDIPREPGVCFQNGFVRGSATDKEQIDMAYAFKTMPDVRLHFGSDSGIYGDGTLLDRSSEAESALRAANGHTLRKGADSTASGVQFEEWLAALHIYPEFSGDSFTMEINGSSGGAKAPLAYVDLYNGQTHTSNPSERHKPSLDDAEAVALWDAITRSVRRRSNDF